MEVEISEILDNHEGNLDVSQFPERPLPEGCFAAGIAGQPIDKPLSLKPGRCPFMKPLHDGIDAIADNVLPHPFVADDPADQGTRNRRNAQTDLGVREICGQPKPQKVDIQGSAEA